MLTTITVSFSWYIIYVCAASSSSDIHSIYAIDNNNNNGAGVVVGARKFGDRISPRHRPYTELDATVSRIAAFGSSSIGGDIISAIDKSLVTNSNNNNNISNSNSFSSNVQTNLVAPYLVHNLNHNNDNNNSDDDDDEMSDHLSVTHKYGSDINHIKRHTSSYQHNNNISLATSSNNNSSNSDNVQALTNVELPIINDNAIANSNNNNNNNTSSAQAHRLEMSTEFFVVPSSTSPISLSASIRPTTIRPAGVVLLTGAAGKSTPSTRHHVTPPTIISTHHTSGSGLRKEPWVVPVLVLASLAMILMAAFEVFVLCKAWRTSPSRRHLFLGQMLLLGLFSCAGLAAVLAATPTLLSCATVRFGAGVAFALVFASLLVKCVFLISLNGGVYLPAPYQGLLLLFAVLIQVAVGGQWLLTSPPAVDNVPVVSRAGTSITYKHPLLLTAQDLTTTVPLCKTQFSELLFSLVYVVFLILFVAILAIKSRGIRDNYREATYIGLAIGGSIPIWLGWTLCGLAVADRHKDACLAFGLVATSATVFLVMFMPKGRQLAAMGKEGLYVEDREEQFSSLSRAGSGYSPSFFHFKPIKYGVMGPAPTSTTTNTGNGTSTKHHQAVATLGGGKFFFFFFLCSISTSSQCINYMCLCIYMNRGRVFFCT